MTWLFANSFRIPEVRRARQDGAASGSCPGSRMGRLPGPLFHIDQSDDRRIVITADRTCWTLAMDEGLSLRDFMSVVSNESLRERGLDCQSFAADLAKRSKPSTFSRGSLSARELAGDLIGGACLFIALFAGLFLVELFQ